MPSGPAKHRGASRAVYVRRRIILAGTLALIALAVFTVVSSNRAPGGGQRAATGPIRVRLRPSRPSGQPRSHRVPGGLAASLLAPIRPGVRGDLAPGSDPRVLPGPILIADKLNSRLIVVDRQGRVRWVWPQPGDLAQGQTFRLPDDAFFSPDGRYIIATQEDDFVITVISIASRKIVWRYGHPGVSGAAPNYVWNPDDAMILRDGNVSSADIKNCRIIEIRYGTHTLAWHEGMVGSCTHNPPAQYGSPNGVFPMPSGHLLITEINGDWVDEIDTSGHVYWSVHPPRVAYPSDSNRIGPDRYLTVDYSSPGQVVIFNRAGDTIWRYAVTGGPGELNHPSLAVALPNGDVLFNDDHNDRVIVIDPHTNRIVWQYGHDRTAGTAAGYLDNPDGLDPLPPYSYADRNQAAAQKHHRKAPLRPERAAGNRSRRANR